MTGEFKDEVLETGKLFATGRYTVRSLAKALDVPKSTVHMRLVKYLPEIDESLARSCRSILDHNRSVRHLRGGEATRKRWIMAMRRKGGMSRGGRHPDRWV